MGSRPNRWLAPDTLRAVVEHTPELVFVFDANLQLRWANPAARDAFSYVVDAHASILDYIHPDDHTDIVAGLDAPESAASMLFRAHDGAASWKWIEASSVDLRSVADPPCIVVLARDITDRRRASSALDDAREALAQSEARFRALVTHSIDITFTVDAEARVVYVSPAAERITGYTPDELVGISVIDLAHPDDVDLIIERVAGVLADPTYHEVTRVRLRTKDGSWRWLEVIGSNHLDDPAINGIVVNARDISTRVAIEQDLAEEKERYQRLIEVLPDLVARYDRDLNLVYANPAAAELLGPGVEGRPRLEMSAVEIERAIDQLRLAVLDGRNRRFENEMVVDGEPRWFEMIVVPDRTDTPGEGSVMTIGHDITLYKHREQRLRLQTLQDPLTGLANRTGFQRRLEGALNARATTGESVAILFLDLDRFKVVNDTYGHPTGDDLLVAVAERFRSAVRPGDLIARFGGDEFAVLPTRLPSREHAERLAARIHATLAEPITLDDVEVRTSASIGIAVADPIRSVPSDVLLQEADLAMYQAKRAGRSRTAVFDSG